jgi:hypothetical protein
MKKVTITFAVLVLLATVLLAGCGQSSSSSATATAVIARVAGNGTNGYSGDNGPATSAMVGDATGVAVGSAGNLYLAAPASDRIRKVSTSGTITTVAGDGGQGYSGDGGPPTSAELYNPLGVAVDSSGNLYIADTQNYVVRKVTF